MVFKITKKKPGTAGSAPNNFPWRMIVAHTVNEDSDSDIEDDPDQGVEWRYRLQRNEAMKRHLQEGIAVQYRQTGDSLYPDVHTRDSCLFEPVFDCGNLKKYDIVFCQTCPDMYYYAHKIVGIHSAESARDRYFYIGNNRGRINGIAYDHTIYGRLVEVTR